VKVRGTTKQRRCDEIPSLREQGPLVAGAKSSHSSEPGTMSEGEAGFRQVDHVFRG